ncbi:MAG: extracellular solute-binding protein, partial [Jiangellaceae bacterium]
MRLRRSAIAVAAVTMIMATACGGDTGPPVLNWYINPDNGGQAELAAKCTDEAEGSYRIETSILPNSASAQREQLIRRLAANDSSIDLMSVDPPFVPEFAEAGFLLDIPDDRAEEFTDGVVESAVTGATWRDELVGSPFWANTQLLWYRRSVAEQAGLDPESGPVSWGQVIDAAEQT